MLIDNLNIHRSLLKQYRDGKIKTEGIGGQRKELDDSAEIVIEEASKLKVRISSYQPTIDE
jgi:hypothetical protein